MRLLLIEDERTLCDAIARRLRRLGYSVDLAYDGEQAMQLLEVEHYDLVLLDLNLPKQDGMTVLLVEQNAFAALSVAHYAYILEVGRVVLEGTGQELLENPKVKEAYLGG